MTTLTSPSGPPVKHPYKGDVRWALWRWADIESAFFPGYTYLRRLRIFQTPWFALYLHFIFEPDLDRDPHDHPCNFWSMILRGGYQEHIYQTKNLRAHNWSAAVKRWGVGSLHYVPVNVAHQIVSLRPRTVTLCWFGRRQRLWGFWTPSGFVTAKDYARSEVGRLAGVMDPFGS